MNKQHLYGLINPFERIAGLKALLWGLAGMVVSTALSFYSGWHYHGLLHFGPAPNPAWWCYVNMPPAEIMQQPGFLVGIWLSLVSFVFLIWALVWMFQALKVSCNLKGYRLGILYCVGIFGGDVFCRYLIKWLCY